MNNMHQTVLKLGISAVSVSILHAIIFSHIVLFVVVVRTCIYCLIFYNM